MFVSSDNDVTHFLAFCYDCSLRESILKCPLLKWNCSNSYSTSVRLKIVTECFWKTVHVNVW